MRKQLACCCLLIAALLSPAVHADSLAEAYAPFFPVGAAVTPGQVMMGNGPFIARQFNILVAENAMKPESLARRGEGEYDFTNADAIVDFAVAHRIKMRGHTLVWHQQTPAWMFVDAAGEPVARAVLIARLQRYIHDVVGHFRGRVFAWDVVNEAFVPDEAGAQQVDGWRRSRWLEIIGPEYIELAFRFAHEADPDALLFYNDYNTQNPARRKMILALVKSLQEKGVAIHGVGHQSHFTIASPPDLKDFEQSIREVAALGLTNHITELDVSLNADLMHDAIGAITPALRKRQTRRYREVFEIALRNRDAVSAVLMWGLNDEVSWLRTWPFARLDAPLLFDGALRPGPAYQAVIDAARKAAATN